MSFDTKTIEELKSYVYALLDTDGAPFYIGKGNGNRVFEHVACALDEETSSDKYDKIRQVKASGNEVEHLILRHDMTDKIAYEVESALIDFIGHLDFPLTNQMLGHHSLDSGLMRADEVIRKYNAEELTKISDEVIMFNINETYKRGSGTDGIYEATKGDWAVKENNIKKIKYVLSEYRGLIVEVFKVDEWYAVPAEDKNGKQKYRWGFNGKQADDDVRLKYINKSIQNSKKRGSSNPIRYKL